MDLISIEMTDIWIKWPGEGDGLDSLLKTRVNAKNGGV